MSFLGRPEARPTSGNLHELVEAAAAEAFDRLPERCREVVWLRRVEELSQKEVAARMGIGEKTVEKQVAKGMRLIAVTGYGQDRDRAKGRQAGFDAHLVKPAAYEAIGQILASVVASQRPS